MVREDAAGTIMVKRYGLVLPGEEEREFLLTSVFVPRGRQNLTAILTASSDPDRYGELTLFDVVSPDAPDNAAFPVKLRTGDLSNVDEAQALVAEQPDVIFHLAAIVSGEAEKCVVLRAACACTRYPRLTTTRPSGAPTESSRPM